MAAITVNPLAKGTMFPPAIVADLVSKVRGTSALARLSDEEPVPFNGKTEMLFDMPNEIDIVAENGAKAHGGIAVTPVNIVPVKFEYGARVSDEFMYAAEEERLNYLRRFNEGFSRKVARGLDLAAFHGVNPRTGSASTVIGTNNFDSLVTTNVVTYNGSTPDANLEAAIAAVDTKYETTGIAMSSVMGAAMGAMNASGVKLYPEFSFGGKPAELRGMAVAVNPTVTGGTSPAVHAYVGNFRDFFRWGYAKEIPFEIIPYGDPDNSGSDLKGHNQVYLRAEIYIGWGILDQTAFARVKASA